MGGISWIGFFLFHIVRCRCQQQWIFLHYHKTGAVVADAIATSIARKKFIYRELPVKRVDFVPRTDSEILLCHAGNFLFNWTEVFTNATFQSKVVHFVRDPYDMALSGLLYHSQQPPPEGWLTSTLNPCTSNEVEIEKFVTTLVTYHSALSKTAILHLIGKIKNLCHEIYQQISLGSQTPSYHKALTFMMTHQQEYKALQLETCRSILSKFPGAGGDILRMAANAVREGQTQAHNFHVSLRVFLSEFSLGNKTQCLNVITDIFRFLLTPSPTGVDFWQNKISLEQAIQIAIKASFIGQPFQHPSGVSPPDNARFLLLDRKENRVIVPSRSQFKAPQLPRGYIHQSSPTRSHPTRNPVSSTPLHQNHITQGSWSTGRRDQLLLKLHQDPLLSPILNLAQLILTNPLAINSTVSKIMTLIPELQN